MTYIIDRYTTTDIFPELEHIPGMPSTIDMVGTLPISVTYISIVGSRDMTSYGRDVLEALIPPLANYRIAVVSGLAYGVDAHAHRVALDAGIPCIAIPGSGLAESCIYPSEHRNLAREIVERGGALISPFNPQQRGTNWTFPVRNKLIAAISAMTIVIEAQPQSGSLITAECALEYGRRVGAVPGSIFHEHSQGTHALLSRGALPIRSTLDISNEFGWDGILSKPKDTNEHLSEHENILIKALSEPLSRSDIARITGLSIHDASIALTMLELRGLVREQGGFIERRR